MIEFVDSIVERGILISANRYLAYTRAFLGWAKGRKIIMVNPAAGLASPSQEITRDRVLSDQEYPVPVEGATER